MRGKFTVGFAWVLLPIFLFLIFQPSTTEAFLARDLSLGSVGEDVRQLQKFLNKTGLTVSVIGGGSSGEETNFFGLLTQNAVRRYQELYQGEILAPIGLKIGTGFVGPLTRAHILKNSVNSEVPEIVDVPTNLIMTPSSEVSRPVVFITSATEAIKEPSGTEVVTTPKETEAIPSGFFPPPPKRSPTMNIFSINPTVGNLNSTVVISGEGFLSENTVYAGNQVFYHLPASADGRTLTIDMKNTFTDTDLRRGAEARGQLIIPLWLYVENETGISNQVIFNLALN